MILRKNSETAYFGVFCDGVWERQCGLREEGAGAVCRQRRGSFDERVMGQVICLSTEWQHASKISDPQITREENHIQVQFWVRALACLKGIAQRPPPKVTDARLEYRMRFHFPGSRATRCLLLSKMTVADLLQTRSTYDFFSGDTRVCFAYAKLWVFTKKVMTLNGLFNQLPRLHKSIQIMLSTL